MCRIWIDGVPPGQQPAPTDCSTAERRRPANARVIYGDDTRRDCRYEDTRSGSTRTGTIRLPDIGGIYDRTRNERCVYGRDDRDDDDRRGVYRRDNDDDRNRVYGRDDDEDDRSGKKLKANKSKHGKGKGKGHAE
jgi:hypothetical protein